MNKQVPATVSGLLIGVLTFLLCLSGIAIFYQAQVIARQAAVIRTFEVEVPYGN